MIYITKISFLGPNFILPKQLQDKKNLIYFTKNKAGMSKKNKGSSAKSNKKKTAKAPKKKVSKKVKPASKKKPAPKKKAKPAKKVVAKKPAKKAAKKSKPAKPVSKNNTVSKSQKTVIKGSIKEYKKPINDIKNPVLLKKENSPIPEFKPIIQPTVKSESDKPKENFPSALKTTTSTTFVSTPVKKADSYSIKPEKEPPGKFEIEIVIRASAELLYEFLVTPSGLSEWF